MMKRYFLFLFIFFFFFFNSYSQVWYFGFGAGLKFKGASAWPVFDGQVFTNEGSAVACDDNNRLLFYTDGITVWNSGHIVMENGEGLNGRHSSTQSVLIVPKPGDKSVFYVFTVDEKGGEKGLCYSVVDFKKNKNGMVVIKNQKLIDGASEKLTAVLHKNGTDIWVIAQNRNQNIFYSFPVTASGIGEPVASPIAYKKNGEDVRQSIGYLRASSDGKWIASAVCYAESNNISLFDFNNSTGVLSGNNIISCDGSSAYGLCFSPDNSKLYVSFLYGKSGIVQFDLETMRATEIASNERENSYGGMQLGPDGKIYVARNSNFLDVISGPDLLGKNCGYKTNAVSLFPKRSAFGLPNCWSYHPVSKDCGSVLEKNPVSGGNNFFPPFSTCGTELTLNAKNPGAKYVWSTGATTQAIKIDTSGVYKVKLVKNNCTLNDSIALEFKKDLSVFRSVSFFNPEEEFLNSEFFYTIDEIDAFDLKVFDRKKKLLFKTNNPEKKWNGRDANGDWVKAGDYDWQVTYKPRCPANTPPVVANGKVTVKRGKKSSAPH